MWIRIALHGPVAYVAEPLAMYRQHLQSGTTTVMASGRNAADEMWALGDVFPLVREIRPELAELEPLARRGVAHRTWCFAEAMCVQGEMNAARTGIRNAVHIWPAMARQPKVWALWAATYAGYRWFNLAYEAKRRLTGVGRVAPAD
jgi:hypothetical protein